jgi:hypothetical protein
MKTWKHYTIAGILAIIALTFTALSLTACDTGGGKPEPVEQPKDQTATINPFENYKVTVKGTFTDSEWKGTAGKIENAIKNSFEGAPSTEAQDILRDRYAKCKVIFLEKTSDYESWKTTGDGETICINYNVLDAENLRSIIGAAVQSIYNGKTEQG